MIKKSEKAIKEMVQRIVEQFHPEKIILFGSNGTNGTVVYIKRIPWARPGFYSLMCAVRTGIRK